MFDPLAHGAVPRKKVSTETFDPLAHGAVPRKKVSTEALDTLAYGAIPKSAQQTPKQNTAQADSYAGVIGKNLNRAALGFLDIPNMLAYGAEGLSNLARKGYGHLTNQEAGKSNYYPNPTPITDYVAQTANKLGYSGFNEPVADTTGKKIAGGIAQGIGGAVTGAGLSSAIKGLGTAGAGVAKFFGANNPTNVIASSGIIGGAVPALEATGVDPLTANIASLATPSLLTKGLPAVGKQISNAAKNGTSIEKKILGINPKNLDIDFLQAAKRQGITEAPLTAASNSVNAGWTEQATSRFPFLGDINRKNYAKAENKLFERIDQILDQTGPVKTEEVKQAIEDAYQRSLEMIRGNPKANVESKKILKLVEDIKKDIAPSAAPSATEKSLVEDLNKIENIFSRSTNDLIHGSKPSPIPIEELVATKRSLNNTIKWDKDEGVRKRLRAVNGMISNTLNDYGKKNPEWHAIYKKAEELHGKTAKRAELENFLVHKSTNAASGDRSYASLSKIIHDKKSASQIKSIVGQEGFKDIADLGTYARRMVQKNKNNPNPSGTAFTTSIMSLLGGLFYAPMTTIGTTIGVARATQLINNKAFIDEAINFSKNQLRNKNNPQLEQSIAAKIKQITGKSVDAISEELNGAGSKLMPIVQNQRRSQYNEGN